MTEATVFRPKQERSALTQAAILQAARDTIDEGGIESLTISGVAARIGLTTGAFYARFRNKDALLAALFAETLVANEDALASLRREISTSPAPLPEVISTFVPRAMKLTRDNTALFRLFGSDHRGRQSERDRAIRILEAAAEPIQALLHERSDEFSHPDPDLAGAMLVVIMQGIVDWALLLRQSPNPVVPTDDRALANEIIRTLSGYLGMDFIPAPQASFD